MIEKELRRKEQHCVCVRCASMYEVEEPVETGTSLYCPECAKNFPAGHFYGKHYKTGLLYLFSHRGCPQCKLDQKTNSVRGRIVQTCGLDLYMRQCLNCCATWIGTG